MVHVALHIVADVHGFVFISAYRSHFEAERIISLLLATVMRHRLGLLLRAEPPMAAPLRHCK